MKLLYGTPMEKHLLGATFLLGAASTALFLSWQEIFLFPYLWIPLYLALSGILYSSFPLPDPGGNTVRNHLYRALPALFFMGAIFLGSSLSFPSGSDLSLSDVYLHMAEYFTLGLFSARMVHPTRTPPLHVKHIGIAVGVVMSYGCFDEIHQYFVPGRELAAQDLVWDLLGGGGGVLVYHLILRRFFLERLED